MEEILERVAENLKINLDEVFSASLHGAPAITGEPTSGPFSILIVHSGRGLRILRRRIYENLDMVVISGRRELEDDSVERFGGVICHLFLYPYRVLRGLGGVKHIDEKYKRHVIVESLRNLILEHRLASRDIIIEPRYFLYEKLRRLSIIYPLSRIMIKGAYMGQHASKAEEEVVRGFKAVLDRLVGEEVLERNNGGYTPSQRFIEETISKTSIYLKVSEDMERIFKLYLSAGQASSLDFLRNMRLDLSVFSPPKIPDPEEMIYIRTALRPQPLNVSLGIREFVQKVYGVSSEVRVRRIGGILNAAYMVSFRLRDMEEKIFVKRYLYWTDFKWVVAWLWALGVRNFSVSASARMSNEIFFVNKLSELGFNTAEILHVNWPRKMLFQRYIDGLDGVSALRRGVAGMGLRQIAWKMGLTLAELHSKGVFMGDCNPHSFRFTPSGEIYLTDLEQCSLDGSPDWDLAELLHYTGHYLSGDEAEVFAENLVKGYLEIGGVDVVKASLNPKYSRLIAPWTPIWIQRRIERGVRRALGII